MKESKRLLLKKVICNIQCSWRKETRELARIMTDLKLKELNVVK